MLVALGFGLLLGFAGSIPPTGPVSVLVLTRGLEGRRREALAIAVGAAAGEAAYCALAVLGVGAAFARWPALAHAASWLAALLLLGLGVHFLRFRASPGGTAPDAATAAPVGVRRRSLALGLGVALANPSMILTWTAAIAALSSLVRLPASTPERATFVAGVAIGIVAWFALFARMLDGVRHRVSWPRLTFVVRAAGAALVAAALISARATMLGSSWNEPGTTQVERGGER